MERASSVKPSFQLTQENGPTVAEICRRLEGLPLALELAAARIRLFPPQALLNRLGSRLQALTGGASDLPSRQQTLRNTIDWSHELLSPAEQRLFARLSVFVGGRSFEAIEAVCNAENDLGIDVLEGIDSLVGKSLLRQEEAGGEPRFVMLETLHEYATEKLRESREEDTTKRLHAEFFLTLAEEAEPHLEGQEQSKWFDALEIDYGNLRSALQWAQELGEKEVGLRLAGALRRLWQVRGPSGEGFEWLTKLLRGKPQDQRCMSRRSMQQVL